MQIPTGRFGTKIAKIDTRQIQQPSGLDVSRAIQGLATAGFGIAKEQKDKDDQALITSQLNDLDAYSNTLQYDPNNGLYAQTGEKAVGATNRYRSQYDDYAKQLSANIPDEIKPQFLSQVESRRIQFSRSGMGFELQQKQASTAATDKAALDNSITRSANYYGDQINLSLEIGSQNELIEQRGIASGKSFEQIQSEQESFTKTAYQAANQNMAASDPLGFLNRTGGSSDSLMQAVFQQESGGRQTDMNGKPLTSPKGAIGIAQIMPDTAPEAAKLAGLEWDEKRYKTDSAYNAALGQAYLEKQLSDFGGNQTLALAAYNAGARNVNDWIKKNGDPRLGEISTAAFIDKIPFKETREYVVNITSKVTDSAEPYQPFYNLDPVEQNKLRNYADSQLTKQKSEYKDYVAGVIKDANTAYFQGKDFPNSPSRSELIKAYGVSAGIREFDQLSKNKVIGLNISMLQKMPYQAQLQYVLSQKPEPGPDFANNTARYSVLKESFERMTAARRADPVQYALEQNQTVALNLSNTLTLPDELNKRSAEAVSISQSYGTPLKIFSNQETAVLTKVMNNAPVAQKLLYLESMRSGINDDRAYMSALQQISPGAKTISAAGVILTKGGKVGDVNAQDAAPLILEGNAARRGELPDGQKTKGIPMPKDNETRELFADEVGDAFAFDSSGAEQSYNVALDYYAGAINRLGKIDAELDKNIFKEAIGVATGGIAEYNDQGNIMLPWGIDEDKFESAVGRAWQKQVIDKGINAGQLSLYGLQSNGDSRYLVKAGTGYLLDKKGDPVIIDLKPETLRFNYSELPQ